MALSTMYGINGVGKDTVANGVAEAMPELRLTSQSRILMHILGLIDNYDARTPVARDKYRQLEDTPQSRMREIEETDFKYFISDIKDSPSRVLMLSHLVFALYLDKEFKYLDDRDVPEWYIASNDAIIQLVAPASTVLQRRTADSQVRDRGALTLENVELHQQLCDKQWAKLEKYAGSLAIPTLIIPNVDLEKTIETVEGVLSDARE